jgi:cytochrome c oxidase subunit 1
MPRIRSERPAFDAKFPEVATESVAGPPEGGARPLTGESDAGATYREDRSDRR